MALGGLNVFYAVLAFVHLHGHCYCIYICSVCFWNCALTLPFSFHPGPAPVAGSQGPSRAESACNSPSNARTTSLHAAPTAPARTSGIPRPKQPQQSHLARIASRLASLVTYHVGGGGGRGARSVPVAPAEQQALLCEWCGGRGG